MQQIQQAVAAQVEYLRSMSARPYTYMYPPPDGGQWENGEYDRVTVDIHDARGRNGALSLDREGFQLRDAPTAVADFQDKEQVLRLYYPEVARLALEATGASRAFVFDHLLRKREPGPPRAFGRREGHRPGAAGRVHGDFTPASALRRLQAELGVTLEGHPGTRYCILNLWRSIRHPVLDAPLAVCDAGSVAPADLVVSDIIYPERRGEIYQALHQARHAWSYFSAMTRDEVLLFKQFDSAAGVACCTPHAAFAHPHAPPDAPLRESIEIRCLLVYDEETTGAHHE